MDMSKIKDLLRIFVPLMILGLTGANVRTISCGGKPADVIFILDSSSSIWRPDFKRQLTFVQEMVDIFPIATNMTRVALITFDSHPRVIFHLNTFRSKSRLRRRIGLVRRTAQIHTRTDRAIRLMRKVAQARRYGARPDDSEVTQVAIIITDGKSDDTSLTIKEAQQAREQGIHLFAIGVGGSVDIGELEGIASKPLDDYVHLVHSYDGLDRIKDLLAIKTCTVTVATTRSTLPTTTSSTTTTSTTRRTTTTPRTTTTTTTASTTTTTTPFFTSTPSTTTTSPSTTTTTPSTTAQRTTTPAVLSTSSSTLPSPTPSSTSTSTLLSTLLVSLPFGVGDGDAERIGPPTSTVRERRPPSSQLPPLFIPPYGIGEFDNPESIYIAKPTQDSELCKFDEPTDIVFVIDEKKGGPDTMNRIWKFVEDLVEQVDMSNGNVNVKFIYECVDIPEVPLGSYRNKTALLSALGRITRRPRASTAQLLQQMSYRLLEGDVNAIEPHHKVGIYITDGPSGNISATLVEAQTGKLLHNIELFGVGIGKDIDPTELRALVSCAVDKHLHMVIRPKDLTDIVNPVLSELCKERKHHRLHAGL